MAKKDVNMMLLQGMDVRLIHRREAEVIEEGTFMAIEIANGEVTGYIVKDKTTGIQKFFARNLFTVDIIEKERDK